MSRPVDILALMDEVSGHTGEPVRLVERQFQGRPVFMVMPATPGRLGAPFWLAVQADPSAGVWDSPERALVAFATGLARWRAAAAVHASPGLDTALRGLLSAGPLPVAVVLDAMAGEGVSRDRVDRAARRLGVVRSKASMAGGWIWALPAEDSEVSGTTKPAKGANHGGAHAQI